MTISQKFEDRVKMRLHVPELPQFMMDELRAALHKQIAELKQETFELINAHPQWNLVTIPSPDEETKSDARLMSSESAPKLT